MILLLYYLFNDPTDMSCIRSNIPAFSEQKENVNVCYMAIAGPLHKGGGGKGREREGEGGREK